VSDFFGIFTGVTIAAVAIAAAVLIFVRKRAGALAETERWVHAAQLSAVLVRDPGKAGRPSAVQVHNAGSADVHGVTLVVRETDTGVSHVAPDAHILSPGYELRLTVPAWACSADRQLFVRFVDAGDVAWDLDVSSGLLREALMAGGHR
jgi:hypothetical protein